MGSVSDSIFDSLAVAEAVDVDAQHRDAAGEVAHLPSGSTLQFSIHSTWGDSFYVGLSGLEGAVAIVFIL